MQTATTTNLQFAKRNNTCSARQAIDLQVLRVVIILLRIFLSGQALRNMRRFSFCHAASVVRRNRLYFKHNVATSTHTVSVLSFDAFHSECLFIGLFGPLFSWVLNLVLLVPCLVCMAVYILAFCVLGSN